MRGESAASLETKTMWAVRAALVALLVVIIIAFAFYNMDPDQIVDVHLQPVFSDRVDVSLVMVVFWGFVSGVVLSLFLFITTYIKLSLQILGMKKRMRSLESEVTILRNRPIEESADLLVGLDNQTDEASGALGEVKSDV